MAVRYSRTLMLVRREKSTVELSNHIESVIIVRCMRLNASNIAPKKHLRCSVQGTRRPTLQATKKTIREDFDHSLHLAIHPPRLAEWSRAAMHLCSGSQRIDGCYSTQILRHSTAHGPSESAQCCRTRLDSLPTTLAVEPTSALFLNPVLHLRILPLFTLRGTQRLSEEKVLS
jgi:hypothetical protein